MGSMVLGLATQRRVLRLETSIMLKIAFLFLLCCTCWGTFNESTDANVLCALYNSASTPFKDVLINWNCNRELERSGPCSMPQSPWQGVSCNTNKRVMRLDLNFSNNPSDERFATLPPTIGGLDALTFLKIEYGGLYGQLPSSLSDLTNLTVLALQHNSLQGGLPVGIERLRDLNCLALQSNKLSGPLPPTIGGLLALTFLDLSKNNISGALPESVGNLLALQHLGLDDNKLTKAIPSSLGSLHVLNFLAIDSNFLTGEIPQSFGDLSLLKKLSLAANKLTGPMTNFTGLHNLSYLDLSVNRLSSSISSSLGGLTGLTYLDLSDNLLSGLLPPSLGDLTQLEGFYLNKNALTGAIPQEYCYLLNAKIDFNFSSSGAVCFPGCFDTDTNFLDENVKSPQPMYECTAPKDDHEGLCALKKTATKGDPSGLFSTWNCSKNAVPCNQKRPGTTQWAGITCDNAGRVTGINFRASRKDVMRADTPITSFTLPTKISLLQSLQTLSITATGLKGTIPSSIGQLTALQTLELVQSDKLGGTLPTQLGLLKGLKTLRLNLNSLTSTIPSALGSLKFLSNLDLCWNQLTGAVPRDLCNLSPGSVHLDHNPLACFPACQLVAVKTPTIQCTRAPTLSPSRPLDDDAPPPPPPPASSISKLLSSFHVPLKYDGLSLIAFFSLLALLFSLVLYRSRRAAELEALESSEESDEEKKRLDRGIVSIEMSSFALSIPLVVGSLASSCVLISNLNDTDARSSYTIGATAGLISVRLCNAAVAIFLIREALYRRWLSRHLNAPLLHRTMLWVLISCICLLDPSQIRLLPWRHTAFSKRSGGFPTLLVFWLSMGSILLTNLVMVVLAVCARTGVSSLHHLIPAAVPVTNLVVSILQVAIKVQAEKINLVSPELATSSSLWEKELELKDKGVEIETLQAQLRQMQLEALKIQIGGARRRAASRAGFVQASSEPVTSRYSSSSSQAERESESQSGRPRAGNSLGRRTSLAEVGAEVDELLQSSAHDAALDEDRVAQLLTDLRDCPEYHRCVEEEERSWQRRSETYCQACRELMRGFVPPHIASATKAQLVSEGINETLATRLLARRCLWLVRMPPEQVDRLSERDLAGRYSTHVQGQGPLDMVELAAIYASVSKWSQPRPVSVRASDPGRPVSGRASDPGSGKRAQQAQHTHRTLFRAAWRARIEAQMKDLAADEDEGVLGLRARHPAYRGQEPRYVERKSLVPPTAAGSDRSGLGSWSLGVLKTWGPSRTVTPVDDVESTFSVAQNPMVCESDCIPRQEGKALSYRQGKTVSENDTGPRTSRTEI